MTDEGALVLQLRVEAGRVSQVLLESTRRTDVSDVLVRRRVDEALTLAGSLFAICGTAHTVAALDAVEAALGLVADDAQRQARRLLAALEAIDNHAFQLCVEWPQRLRRPPEVERLKPVRAATAALRTWALPGRWAVPGGVSVPEREAPGRLLAGLDAAVTQLVPDAALASEASRVKWMKAQAGPVAVFLQAMEAIGGNTYGHATAPLMAELSANWYGEQLLQPAFSARPTLLGQVAETGALAMMRDHPVVEAALTAHGRTVTTRLVAKLVHLRQLARDVAVLAQELRPTQARSGATTASGRGAGVADTARGRLAHAVEVAEGQVVAWRTVAPTEWTFHPLGVVQEALRGLPALDLHRRAEGLVAALDPCVPCTVSLEGAE